MNKLILIDGNNLMFRSYYATAYNGITMKNSKGLPTNALYGLINMLNRIIVDEKPTHIMIAFDVGKTFRHESYKDYKAGRSETPIELKKQLERAKEVVESMGIKYFGIPNYEADDIIGTFASYIENHEDSTGLIVSSDKDLIQLITDKVKMKLLKSNDYIMMDKSKFKEVYGLDDPKKMIDLKALMGDSSDNIPGVHGIGEKGAIKLLQKYGSLDLVYEHLDEISNATKNKLIDGKDDAYMSYNLATIYKDVPIDINLEDIEYHGYNNKYLELLNEFEFYSILRKLDTKEVETEVKYTIVKDLQELKLEDTYSLYLETLGYNYHLAEPLGVSISDSKGNYYIPFELLKNTNIFKDNKKKYTYDLKKLLYIFSKYNIEIDKKIDDLMLIAYLLNKNIKTDIAVIANTYSYNINFYDKLYGSEITIKMPNNLDYIKDVIKKSYFIYKEYDNLYKELELSEMINLYHDIELPLTYVLKKMEENGFMVDKNYFEEFGSKLDKMLDEVGNKIYDLAGMEFNILSTKILGDILFNKLHIPYPKRKTKL